MNTILPENEQGVRAGDFRIMDLLLTFAKYKKLLILLPITSAILAVVVSFMLPSVYQANTKLLPPQQAQSGAAALLSQLGGVASAAAGIAGIKSGNDVYVSMLKSRTVADILVSKFDLKRTYDTDSQEKARRFLEERTMITTGKDGLIVVAVEDERREVVAKLANGYVDELVKLTRVLALTEAAQRRVFFEQQLILAKDNLSSAEATLKSSIETHGVISVDGDSRAIMETAAKLRAQISAKEIELNSMAAFVTENNPQFQRASEELRSARAELFKIQNGRSGEYADGVTDKSKNIGLEAIKVLRDVKYYQMLYELLAKQYEVARLDEAKDPSIIQVLDPAVEPERRIAPKRALIVLLAVGAAFVLALILAVLLEEKRKALNVPEQAAEWEQLKSYLWKKR